MMMSKEIESQFKFQFSRLFLLGVILSSGCSNLENEVPIEQLVTEMNQRIEVVSRAETKNNVVPRFNQSKTVACLNAQFRVHDFIPENLKQGVFSQAKTYPALLRFANATNQDDSKKDIRGLSIKLSDVDGSVLWGQPGVQDFILNSYPALFVATPEEFLAFIRARQEDAKLSFFLNPFDSHLKSFWIVMNARQKHMSLFDIRYWSTVPFQFGESTDQVVKYSVIPCSDYETNKVVNSGENQLRSAMKSHLRQGTACFQFAVQKQTDTERMPIDDATVIWDEALSPFQTLATITIENQVIDDPKTLAACERSHFNPWQSLTAHKPLGRMNEVRRLVYENAARLRQKE